MKLKVGSRYRSRVCETEVIVVRAPADDVSLECGGEPMGDGASGPSGAPHADLRSGSLLGKRYTDGADLEVLVVRGGDGTLGLNGTPLHVQPPRVLPSSD